MATVPDSHRDLLDAPVATLATVGADGRPQLSAVWFLADGDNVRVSLNTSRQKTKNLNKNSAATLFILDTANPARYLELRGDAKVAPDDDYAFADQIGAKYGGVDLRTMDQPGAEPRRRDDRTGARQRRRHEPLGLSPATQSCGVFQRTQLGFKHSTPARGRRQAATHAARYFVIPTGVASCAGGHGLGAVRGPAASELSEISWRVEQNRSAAHRSVSGPHLVAGNTPLDLL